MIRLGLKAIEPARRMRKGWGRCWLRLQPSDYYFGTRGGALLVLLVRLPGLAGFGAQTIAVDQVADGRPGNLAVAPKLQLDQIALGGAGEGGKLLVGLDLGVEVAAAGEDGGRVVHLAGDVKGTREPVAQARGAIPYAG